MRKFLLVATMALGCGAAHAETLTQAAPAVEPAQAAPAPQAAAPAAAPAPQASAPDAAKPSKPAKKQQARRRETDEEKARRIAAKYGVSW